MKKKLLILLIVGGILGYGMYSSGVTFDDIKKFDFKTIEQKMNKKIEDTKNDIINETGEKEIVNTNESGPFGDISGLESVYGSYKDNSKDKSFSFSSAKKNLEKKIYDSKEDRKDNYCGHSYQEDKRIDFSENDGFKSNFKNNKRSLRIEWEHVVPAENFGRHFKEWREGNPKLCGEGVKGRKCASKNDTFSAMEGDIFNLIPANGEVNGLRSNINYGMVTSGNYKEFGSCNFKIDTKNNVAEPPDEVKGQVARISMYFALKYKDYYKISEQQLKLFQAWNKQFPPSSYECKINKEKENLIGYKNIVTSKECSSAGL